MGATGDSVNPVRQAPVVHTGCNVAW